MMVLEEGIEPSYQEPQSCALPLSYPSTFRCRWSRRLRTCAPDGTTSCFPHRKPQRIAEPMERPKSLKMVGKVGFEPTQSKTPDLQSGWLQPMPACPIDGSDRAAARAVPFRGGHSPPSGNFFLLAEDFLMVRQVGLEPTRLSTTAFETVASTNSATTAKS